MTANTNTNAVTFADLTADELIALAGAILRSDNDAIVLYLIGRELLTRYRQTCAIVDEMASELDDLEATIIGFEQRSA